MSHISRICSRMSSGSPLSGRFIATSGRPRSRAFSDRRLLNVAGRFDALLNLANAGQIFVELPLVAGADLPAQAGGLLAHAVQNALVPLAAMVVEQAVERQRRIFLQRHRRGRILPRDIRAVGHREIRLVIAGGRLLAAQHQARLHGLFAQAIGEHLIHADCRRAARPLFEGERRRADCPSARDECRRRWPPC